MSLFPAYSAVSPSKEGEQHDPDKSWLANGSFLAAKDAKSIDEGGLPGDVGLKGAAALSTVPVSHTDPITHSSSRASDDEPPAPLRRQRPKHRRHRSRSRSSSPSRNRSPSPSRRRHNNHKHHHKKRKHRQRASPPRAAAAELPPLRGVFLEDAAVRPEAAFSVDRRLDRAARAFPEMYHHYVARYLRVCGVLGRPRTGRRLAACRYFDRSCRRRLRRVPADTSAVSCLPLHHSYVPLSTPAATPPPPPEQQPEQQSDPADYLSSLSSEVAFEFSRETAALNRRLAASPRDVPLWLEMVAFQQRRLAGRVTAQQLLERQLAVLERALRQCRGSESAPLRLRRLELRQHEQPPEEARKEWTQLLFSQPANLSLWRRYLASEQHSPSFTLPAMVSAFTRCLEKMRQFQADAARPHRPPPALEQFMLEVVGHLCRILRQAGYTERAIAIYQALIELNLFSPPLDGGSAMGAMEPFWDSRLPRVGEPGARGWPAEVAARQQRRADAVEVAESADQVEDQLLAAGGAKADIWRRVESRRTERHWLPWDRPGEEDDCDDTDRIVLFEDVKGFLFRVAPELFGRIVEEFVSFLCGEESEVVASSGDETLRMLALDAMTLQPPPEVPPPSDTLDSSASPLTTPPLGPTLDSLEYSAFIGRVLEQTAATVPAGQRTQLLQRRMRFLTRRASSLSNTSDKGGATVAKESRRRLKGILKAERQSVPLFVEYAEFERTAGSPELASHVLQTALAQCAMDDPVRFEIVHRYCLLRVSCSAPADAADGCRAAICGLFEEFVPSAAVPPPHKMARAVSRLRRLLPELTGLSAGGRLPDSAVHVTCCLAWSLLLTAGLQEAAGVIETVLADLSNTHTPQVNSVTSSLHRAGCHLLAAGRPLADPLSWQRHLQRALQAALGHLPLDAELTWLATRHCPVPWRQRLSAVPDCDPPLLSLLRAAADVRQLSVGPKEAESSASPAAAAARLRRRLARLVELPQLQHWLPLWLLYLELELRSGGKDLEAVCYRAVQACPWSKQAYLYLSQLQLRRACDLMSRVGLRLHLPLEELDLLLEDEPEHLEPEEDEEEGQGQTRGRRRDTSGAESDTGSGSESDSESEVGSDVGRSESEGDDSGPGTPPL